MRGRVLLGISLGLNAVLAWLLLSRVRHAEVPPGGGEVATPASPTNILFRTNTIIRRLNFVWGQIESSDYRVFISNLREIGCPEPTIRDIIVAEVDQIFARRRSGEIVTPQQQWWLPEPDPRVMEEAARKLGALEAERESLLTTLLGPQWQSSFYPHPDSPQGNPLDGALLGSLSPESKQAVREVERQSRERRDAYLRSTQARGGEPDDAELNRLRQQSRSELAAILTPEQLEEYLLRYSQRASDLRGELRGLTMSPDEFRSLFRLRDALDPDLQGLAEATDATGVQRRQELEQKRDAAMEQILGADQFREYQLNQDPLYRDSRELARQLEVPDEKVMPLYGVNQTTEQERQRIRNDTSLTTEQRALALEEVQTSRAAALRRLLGEELFERYQRTTGE